MSEKIRLVQGDTRPQIIFSVTDERTGNPVNLSDTNTIARLKFRQVGSPDVKETMICGKLIGFEKADGTIDYAAPYNVPGAGGRLYMDWTPTALDTAGEFEGELEVTYGDGSVQTAFNPMKFKVRGQF